MEQQQDDIAGNEAMQNDRVEEFVEDLVDFGELVEAMPQTTMKMMR